MTKILRSRLFIGIACLVLAAVIAFGALPMLYGSRTETVSVVVLKQDIRSGTTITQAMLTSADIPAYSIPEGVVMTEEEAVGMVAGETLYAGEYLSAHRIITGEEYAAISAEQTKGLSAGYCLVTLEFPSASSGVASVLRAGNIVDVYESIKQEDGSITTAKTLSSMYVYDVLNSNLESLHELDEKLADALVEEDTDYDFAPAYVVFRCTDEQAATLIRLEQTGSLHLTLDRTVS